MGFLTPDVLKVGEGGLLALVFIAMLMGWIVPRPVMNRLLSQANDNAKMWQGIASQADERADLAVKQSGQMLAGFDTLDKTIRAQVVPTKETA